MKRIVSLLLIVSMMFTLCGCASGDYKNAVALYEAGNYEEAKEAFEALGDYKDSADRVADCEAALNYNRADALFQEKQYEEAKSCFEAAGDFEDSAERVKECSYLIADRLFQERQFEEAKSCFEAAGDFEDSAERVKECSYQIADLELFRGNADAAEAIFTELGLYKDSAAKITACKTARADLEAMGIFGELHEALLKLEAYKESNRKGYSLGQSSTYQAVYNSIGTTTFANVAEYLGIKSTYVREAAYIAVYGDTRENMMETYKTLGKEDEFKEIEDLFKEDGNGGVVYAIAKMGLLGQLCFWAVQLAYREDISLVSGNMTSLQKRLDAFAQANPQYSMLQPLTDMHQGIVDLCTWYQNPDGTLSSFNSSLSGKVNAISKPDKELETYFRPPVKGVSYQCTSLTIYNTAGNDISHSTSDMNSLVSAASGNSITMDDSHERACLKVGKDQYFLRLKPYQTDSDFACVVIWETDPELLADTALSSSFLSFNTGSGTVTLKLKYGGDKTMDYETDLAFSCEVCMVFEVKY